MLFLVYVLGNCLWHSILRGALKIRLCFWYIWPPLWHIAYVTFFIDLTSNQCLLRSVNHFVVDTNCCRMKVQTTHTKFA